jgi:hypothetical protein
MRCDPDKNAGDRLELEFGFYRHSGALRAVSALFGAAHSIDCTPGDLSAMLDLVSEQAHLCQRLAGMPAPPSAFSAKPL